MIENPTTPVIMLVIANLGAWVGSIWMAWMLLRRWWSGSPLVPQLPEHSQGRTDQAVQVERGEATGDDSDGDTDRHAVPWKGRHVLAVIMVTLLARLVGQTAVSRPDDITSQLLGGLLGILIGTAASIVMLLNQGASWSDLGLWPLHVKYNFRLAIGSLFLVLAPLLAVAFMLNQIVPYEHPIIEFLTEHRDMYAIVIVVVTAIIVAPLAEEILFRRVLQGWLESLPLPNGPTVAVCLSALAFGAAHIGQGLAWLPLTILGVVLGVLVKQTGSVVPAILLHAMFNAVSVGLLLLQLSGLVPEG